MLNEIEQLINTLEAEGLITPQMGKNEVIRLVYGLMMVSGRGQISNMLTTWQRCSFLRRHLHTVLQTPGPDCIETLNMLRKGALVTQMAKHFQISESYAYSICGTCIELFKSEKRIK